MAFVAALRAGFGAVRRSKRLVGCAALPTVLLSLPFALWMGRSVHALGAHRPDATDVSKTLDPDFFADVRGANPSFDSDANLLVVAALLLAFAVRPLVWGGYVGIAATRKRATFARFVREGGSVYWKFLRISAVEVVLLGVAAVALKAPLSTVSDFTADAAGDVARRYMWVTQALLFGALCLVALVADYARIGVRMRRRPGVLAEVVRSAWFVAQHPLQTIGLLLVGLALEAACVAPFLLLMRSADGAKVGASLTVLVLGTLAVVVREGARLFHVAAAWTVRAAEDRPRDAVQAREGPEGPDVLEERLPWHVG
jgi:hypothetical protein